MVKLNQFAAAGSYAITSVLILLFNKAILTTYSFKYPFAMALSHMVVGLVLLHVLKTAGAIKYSAFDPVLARKALPVSLCFIANVVLGMVALRGTNIPMFATLRRLTVMMVVMCEVIVLRKKQTGLTVISVLIMILGSFVGGWGDLQFDLFGYTMVLLNNLVTALNLVFIKKTLSDTKLAADTFGVLYYNSLISIPFLLALSVLSGEVGALRTYAHWNNTSFQASFLISALMSFLMNYSTYWCTEVNSALTTSVTGQVKNVLSSFVALSMFGMKATPLLVAGLTIGLLGSIMYAYAVHLQDKAKRAVAAANKAAEANLALQGPVSGGGPVSLTNGSPANSQNGGGVESRPLLLHHARNNAAVNHHDDSLMDAKIARLEAGQRSPAVLAAAAAAMAAGQGQGQGQPTMMNFPSASSSLGMAGSPHAHQQHHLQPHNPPSSPNLLHPYNNPYKSKPN